MAVPTYVPGQELKIRLTTYASATASSTRDAPSEEETPHDQVLVLDIVRVFSSSTLSVVLCVKVKQSQAAEAALEAASDPGSTLLSPGTTYVLKLFDRRHMNNIRTYCYDNALETDYQNYLARPNRVPIAYTDIRPKPEILSYDEEDDPAIQEGWLEFMCADTFSLELETYRRLMLESAKHPFFPHFYGSVEAETDIGRIHGLLVEHIYPSVTLSQFVKQSAPCGYLSEKVEQVCQKALDSLMRLHDDILNDDVRFDNILVRLSDGRLVRAQRGLMLTEWPINPSPVCPAHIEALSCVFVDFGETRPRHVDETHFEWCRAKEWSNEAAEFIVEAALRFLAAGEIDCPYHDQLCRQTEPLARDSEGRDRIGDLGLLLPRLDHDPFHLDLTDEETLISDTYPVWGLYENRPHAKTYEEALEHSKKRQGPG